MKSANLLLELSFFLISELLLHLFNCFLFLFYFSLNMNCEYHQQLKREPVFSEFLSPSSSFPSLSSEVLSSLCPVQLLSPLSPSHLFLSFLCLLSPFLLLSSFSLVRRLLLSFFS